MAVRPLGKALLTPGPVHPGSRGAERGRSGHGPTRLVSLGGAAISPTLLPMHQSGPLVDTPWFTVNFDHDIRRNRR